MGLMIGLESIERLTNSIGIICFVACSRSRPADAVVPPLIRCADIHAWLYCTTMNVRRVVLGVSVVAVVALMSLNLVVVLERDGDRSPLVRPMNHTAPLVMLYYAPVSEWIGPGMLHLSPQCKYRCEFTQDIERLDEATAVLFHVPTYGSRGSAAHVVLTRSLDLTSSMLESRSAHRYRARSTALAVSPLHCCHEHGVDSIPSRSHPYAADASRMRVIPSRSVPHSRRCARCNSCSIEPEDRL